jgi:type IV secretion system coupling TraD/TrwB family protein
MPRRPTRRASRDDATRLVGAGSTRSGAIQGAFGQHLLDVGQVRIGVAVDEPRNPPKFRGRPYALDTDVLRTSMLVVGPPGSGKTRSFALPVLEHLSLQAQAGHASVVAVDPKGQDFTDPDLFDVVVDPTDPSSPWGFDLYGGAESAEEAADRLASALIPPGTSADKAYFVDASKNALYQALAPFVAAHDGRYPTIGELLALLDGDTAVTQSVRDRLAHQGLLDRYGRHLDARARQRARRDDPAASLVERLGLLDRPSLVRLFDGADPDHRFAMRAIDEPTRVRIVIPESQYPEASIVLARLAVAQFVQVASSPTTNQDIFKALLVDEAGRYVDDYVARGVQRLRAGNAGLVLVTQSLADFPEELRPTIFGSAGCKAVFAGLDPSDARLLSEWWGTHWVPEVTVSRDDALSRTVSPGSMSSKGWRSRRETRGTSTRAGVATRKVERPLWSPAEIINDVPPGHALVSLARSDGARTPPVLVDLRA